MIRKLQTKKKGKKENFLLALSILPILSVVFNKT